MFVQYDQVRSYGRRLCASAPWAALLLALCLSEPVAASVTGISDEDIAIALQSELLTDEGVPSHLLEVGVRNGVVTLSGSVDNLLAKERAEKLADATRGVRSVVNLIEVVPVGRDDSDIRNDVMVALSMDPAADSYELGVQVDDGGVTLTGTVESWQERYIAAEVTKGVRGVRSLTNDITVKPEKTRPDSEIRAEIERRLEIDVFLEETLIDVDVSDGMVKLTGTVGSRAEKLRARFNSMVAGVREVDDGGLKVKEWARDMTERVRRPRVESDDEIENAVLYAFLYDPRVNAFSPSVRVESGKVYLTGEVGNLAAKKAAGETALNTIGVWHVVNLLSVRPDDQPSDAVLRQRVADALVRDPYVSRHEIDVVAQNGKVYLYGKVDSEFESERAETDAAVLKGVIEVENRLEVQAWTRKPDWEIREDVVRGLYWDPYVDGEGVSVTVDRGVVYLAGTVDTWLERRMAESHAWESGADDVDNNLRVRGSSYPYALPSWMR